MDAMNAIANASVRWRTAVEDSEFRTNNHGTILVSVSAPDMTKPRRYGKSTTRGRETVVAA
jgi:hypothetical protein